ncbi:MAG: RNA-binding protein [Deltaproteobacteria bacterium]|nr:RNA-binding protein [Deltaproteobacteria bacterium]
MSVRLFVGNLSYDTSEADLRELFSQAGAVTQVRIPVDRETGRPRGFAFVDLAERAEAEEAIRRFHQQTLLGRTLAVSEAVAREDAPRGGAGGGGGGGGGLGPRPAYRPAPAMGNERQGGGAPPVRTFGPDALPKGRRKPEGGRPAGSGPKGPIKERAAGRSFGVANDEDGDDEVPFWAKDDGKDADTDE